MTRGFPLLLIAALASTSGACATRSLTSSGSATTPSPATDVFACIRKQIGTVGFSQDSYDTDELRVTAHKYDEKTRRPDTRFRRLVDRLSFDVTPAAAARDSAATTATTAVTAQASTFVELSTHRGPTEQQERTSETAKEAASTILGRCATPAP